ncbi:ZIP family metal transporter [Candidatus Woesearchaeota archaeon]|nr:ZIP family metal transporter [Candidatus Woesearchaeota archaeon]
MESTTLYTIGSVLVVSLVSLIGIVTLAVKGPRLKNFLALMVSFSAGALFGDAFIHLLPEAVESRGFSLGISLSVLLGVILSFSIEKVIHWRHCHLPITKAHAHPLSLMSLIGDGVHNFIDGLIIGAGYLASIPTGIATTVAVILHEIPQEISDIAVLLYGGFSRSKALFVNFLTALTSLAGALVAILIGSKVEAVSLFLVPFAAGGFIYIAGSDLIPELHKDFNEKKSLVQILSFIFGVGMMVLLLAVEI